MPQINMKQDVFVRRHINPLSRIASLAVLLLSANLFSAMIAQAQQAQLLHPVVLLKGTVRSEATAKPTSIDVSIRAVDDTAREITKSHSNSATGKYAVVLMPGQSYWVHLESDTTRARDVLFTTPPSNHFQEIVHDFTVALRDAE